MENILFYIQQYFSSMTPSEKLIASKIVESPRSIIAMKISDLAEKSRVSCAAVTRFCKRLGLSGYQELKMQIAKDVYLSQEKGLNLSLRFSDEIDIHTVSEVSEVIKNVLSTVNQSLELLDRLTNVKHIELAINMIRSARKITIIGIGASGLVGLDLYQKLLRLGLPVSYNFDTHLQMVSASTLSKGSLALVFSYSGETSEILAIARQAKDMGASIIGITRVGDTSLTKLSDVTLSIPNTENICRNGAFISRLNQLIINDMIFFSLLSQHYDEYYEQIDKTWQGVSLMAPKVAKLQSQANRNSS
ncbi:MAG: MurR/RpiR family transcriptional regulator [Sphaerochaetaceae bacterium]|nr:MurR/RpiR family transcriptional regulator [Sphaerochaetaceae bacterium]